VSFKLPTLKCQFHNFSNSILSSSSYMIRVRNILGEFWQKQECLHFMLWQKHHVISVNRQYRKFIAKQILFTITQRPCQCMLITAHLPSKIQSLDHGKWQEKCCGNNDIRPEHTQWLYYASLCLEITTFYVCRCLYILYGRTAITSKI
jgi:hypothetical protein